MANGTWVFIPTASSVLIGEKFYQPTTDLTARMHAGDESGGNWGPIAMAAYVA